MTATASTTRQWDWLAIGEHLQVRLVGPRCMVALGDSVTAGVGDQVDCSGRLGWSGHLATALNASAFHNLARNGARARDVRDRQLAAAISLEPDLATLLVGGNDVLRGDFNPSAVGRDVSVICEALGRIGAEVVVVLLHDPRDSLPGPKMLRSVLARRAHAVNQAVREAIGSASHVTLVDPRGRFDATDRSMWTIDRMHPGPLGHRALAQLVIDDLTTWRVSAAIPAAPADRPSGLQQVAWLVCHGVPWFAKRSRDLLPELARVCWAERHIVSEVQH